ncbi:hypothetical protein BGX38DRAFT_871125 [Terfezia claveryi]|nr:hypothetical protein BGX38DRAFT_871125 [Terfezia claveryi]
MATNHRSYPPILPRTALQTLPQPLPRELRVTLTERLQGRRCQITRGFLAALNQNLLHAAPIAEQREIHAWLGGLSERGLTQLAQTFTAALRQWLAHGGTSRHRQSTANSATRSTATQALALERDNHMCVLTCGPEPQVAHIVPFSLARLGGPIQQTMPSIFAFLRVFAGPTVVRNLEAYLFGGHGSSCQINRVENLLSLRPDPHHDFGSGKFVLEPVGDPLGEIRSPTDVLTSYQLRFSWVTENRPAGEGAEHAWDLIQVWIQAYQYPRMRIQLYQTSHS